jgi:hypothetical protein
LFRFDHVVVLNEFLRSIELSAIFPRFAPKKLRFFHGRLGRINTTGIQRQGAKAETTGTERSKSEDEDEHEDDEDSGGGIIFLKRGD